MNSRSGDQIPDSERSDGLACAIDKGFQALHACALNFFSRLLWCGCLPAGLVAFSSCSSIGGFGADSGANTVKPRKRDKQVIALGEAEGYKALEERFAFDSRSLKRDERGNFTGPVRSQYDSKRNVFFGGGVGKSVYSAGNYESTKWKNSRKLQMESYRRNGHQSRFQEKPGVQITSPAHLARKSRFDNQRMKTGPFATAGAREGAEALVDKPSNIRTDLRREVFPEPTIISDDEYNRRSVEQTRNLLGRDE
ncbi:MAG: hypothetical protein CMN02_04490 [Roseibacillus sp.]|nr:hypothetical protein [Roseibacillus sp.]